LPLHPTRYAELLHQKLRTHGSTVWLVNTGWTGGPYGQGNRIKLAHTRALVRAALSGTLANVPTAPDPVFGVLVPTSCPGAPSEILQPRSTWRNPNEYDIKARQLAALFQKNFGIYSAQTTEGVRQAGPKG
jgi:phosphoenolpyruvate carboxykinase (ATP)